MLTLTERIDSISDIRNYVNQTLCEQDYLELDCYPITEKVLVRNGVPCGLYFCLYGPRSVRLTAIWETDSNTILFYCSRGHRFQKTQILTPAHFCCELAAAA